MTPLLPCGASARQVMAGSLRSQRSVIASIPGGELHDLSRERALLGCSYLSCTHRPYGGEKEVAFRPCRACGNPSYCSEECADAAYRQNHHTSCQWKAV